jgi:hypothetical protein
MFSRDNANKKSFHNNASGNENREPASSWDCPKAVVEVVAALNNFADIYAYLWPQDPTPRILLRVLTHYQFAAAVGGSEKDKCKMMEEFCDAVMRENARKAIVQDLPLSFQQAKERWRDIAEQKRSAPYNGGGGGDGNKTFPQTSKNTAAASTAGSGSGGANGGGGGGRRTAVTYNQTAGRSGIIARNAVVKFQGDLVCFHYNNVGRGCGRPSKGAGCDDGRGGTYAHVCNFETSPGTYCFARHPRHANH